MKKILTILMLAIALMACGVSADAKTSTKKKAATRAASSIKFSQFDDGYPDVGGHVYTGTIGPGYKITVTFGDYTGSNSEVLVKVTYRGEWAEELNNWYYEGDGVIMFYLDGGTPCYFEIRNGGKELYNEESGSVLKAIK